MKSNYVKYNGIQYVMPFLFCNDIFIPILNKLLENEYNPIKYIYGSVSCAWAGGRRSDLKLSLNSINKYLYKIKKYNVTPLFTFNSVMEQKELLNDNFANSLLDLAVQHNCYFIVTTDMLYKHIKSRYKEAKLICSVIKATKEYIKNPSFDETLFYKKMLDKYDIIVVRPEWTIENITKINSLIKDIDRIEVLINQNCHYNCLSAYKHYEIYDKYALDLINQEDYIDTLSKICMINKEGYIPLRMNKDIINKLIENGVKLFKFQGREFSFDKLFDDLYEYLFNENIPKTQIREEINKICLELIQNNKLASLNLI